MSAEPATQRNLIIGVGAALVIMVGGWLWITAERDSGAEGFDYKQECLDNMARNVEEPGAPQVIDC